MLTSTQKGGVTHNLNCFELNKEKLGINIVDKAIEGLFLKAINKLIEFLISPIRGK
jgi:hypothetical protein